LSREGDKKDISIEASHQYGGKCWRSGVCHSRRNHLLHLLNDVMQALLAAIYPMLKSGFALSFGQIGVLTLIFRVTASLLQPMGGLYTDRRPQPYSLPLGMACSLIGMVTLAKGPYVPISQQGPAFRPYRSSFAAIAVSEYRE
jgi:hypothetical protein